MPLCAGTRLGTYEIIGPLGAGGMGEVYRARDTRLGRQVAVKVLPPEVASSPDRLVRFEREARTVAGLNHPNIVTLFSVEDEDGVRFLTMELVEGTSLAELVTQGGLPLSRVLDFAIPLAEALVAAHDRGVVHRDLKPANIVVSFEGRLKVLDFGLAKTMPVPAPGTSAGPTLEADAARSAETPMLGTVPYMAPEQVRGEPVDARSDLFALGIVIYELIAGTRPFAGRTPADVTSAILRDIPVPLTHVRADVPSDLDRIVNRCLEKDPRLRYQTAVDVCNELRLAKQAVDRELSAARAPVAARAVPSIAVLPFVNRSRDEDDEYFSDGLADELLNVLSKIRGLRVAARTSAFQFKGKSEDVAVIGQRLNVASLLEGSVRKAGNRVRVSVQLVKLPEGYHLWSETYDRTMDDIFAVQDDIARAVVKELRTTLLGREVRPDAGGEAKAEVAAAVKGRGRSAEAHRLHLQGRHLMERLTREDLAQGIAYLREALVLDPNNARAWADLARAYMNEAGHAWAPVAEGFTAAREAVDRALAIEPDLAEGHLVLGRIRLYVDWDWKGAEAAYSRAMELAPGNAVGSHGAGILLENQGRSEEAIELYRRAVEQDPLSAGAYDRLGTAYRSVDRLAESESALRKALELSPQRVTTRASLAQTLLAQGRTEEALGEAGRVPDPVYGLMMLAVIHHARGEAAESAAALRKLIATGAEASAFQIAEAYAARGDPDTAFTWLDRARIQRDPGLAEIKLSRLLRPLHGDPRWTTFLEGMGLPTH
jgi:eukaryotic-like serine/threonine-protein kinase